MNHWYRPYEKGDVYLIESRPYEQKFINMFGYELMEARFTPSTCYTFFVGDTCIGAAGIYVYWQGVAECWMHASIHFYKYKILCFRYIRKFIDIWTERFQLHRMQTLIDASMKPNQEFMEALGFHVEGIHKKYGPWKEDMMMYARLWERST